MSNHMPNYYEYNNHKYSIYFPLKWAIDHLEKTGPHECLNCLVHGCINDVFTKYCINCQEDEYNFTRIPNNINIYDLTEEHNNLQIIPDENENENEISLKLSSSVLENLNELTNIDTLSTTTESASCNETELYDSNYEYDDDPF